MKRTRKELVEFLFDCERVRNIADRSVAFGDHIADKLIQGGWVKVEEPREFWIVTNVVNSEKVVWDTIPTVIYGGDKKVIHVREVIEDSND